ncbi:transposase, partial [Desulfobacterota bacterium M19]
MNMVRAGVVKHPSEYSLSGFNEIQRPPKRYTVIDRSVLLDFFCIGDEEHFRKEHYCWVEEELHTDAMKRKEWWSESIAVGSKAFVKKIQGELGARAAGRSVIAEAGGNVLKEPSVSYNTLFGGKKDTLRPENSYLWELNDDVNVIAWSDPN